MSRRSKYADQGSNNLALTLRLTFTGLLLSFTCFIPSTIAKPDVNLAYHRHAAVGHRYRLHGLDKWRVGVDQRILEGVLTEELREVAVHDIVIPTGRRLRRRSPIPAKPDHSQGDQHDQGGNSTGKPMPTHATTTTAENQTPTPSPAPKTKPKDNPVEPGCYSLDDSHCPGSDKCCSDTSPICLASNDGTYLCVPDPKARPSTSSTSQQQKTTTQSITTPTSTQATSMSMTAQTTMSLVPTTLVVTFTRQHTAPEETNTPSTTSSAQATQTSALTSVEQFDNSKTPMISGIIAGSIVAIVLGGLAIRIIVNKRKEQKGMERIHSPAPPALAPTEGTTGVVIAPAVLSRDQPGRVQEMKEYTGGHDVAGPQHRYATDGQPLTPPSPPPSAAIFPQYRAGTGSVSPSTPATPSPLSAGYNHNLYSQGMYDEDAQYYNDRQGPLSPQQPQHSQVDYMYHAPVPPEPSRSQTLTPNPGLMRMPTVLRVGETKGRWDENSPVSRSVQSDEIFYGGRAQ